MTYLFKRKITKEVFSDNWLGIKFSEVFKSIGRINNSKTFGVIDPVIFLTNFIDNFF